MKKLISGVSLLMLVLMPMKAATLNVVVPDGTKKCYVCGGFNNWDAASAPAMISSGENLFTLDLPEADDTMMAKGYKYLCGQDWLYVEKDASGGEVANRTKPGNPDKVASWRSIPEWTIETADLIVNGIPRKVKIYLPKGYEEDESATYPIIYYNTVQQRYSNAGDDNDNGDNFFGPLSWNAHDTMEKLRDEGSPAYIMVQVPSFLAENTMAAHPEFMGTGAIESYFQGFASTIIPYMEENFRVRKGANNTVIAGADYGALFAIYAAASHPELFSRCVAMSPMLWINRSEFMDLASRAADNRYYISTGSLEPEWIRDDASEFHSILSNSVPNKAYFTIYPGESHNDDSWGKSFPFVLKAIAADDMPIIEEASALRYSPASEAPKSSSLESAVYTLYAGPDENSLDYIGQLSFTDDYRKKGSNSPVKAQVITYDIPTEYKSKYYWNIACGEGDAISWLYSAPKNIGFSSKKSDTSWHNIAIFEDGSLQNNAVLSKGFKVVTAKESILMTQSGDYTSVATVKFPGEDKTFKIHMGSVNTGTDLGAITPAITLSDNCVEAEISYDFNLNKVIVNETQFGESLDNVKVVAFTAVPSVATEGSNVNVNLQLNNDCDIELDAKHNFNENVGLAFTKITEGNYSLTIENAKEGIYALKISLIAGNNRIDDAAEIDIRVLPLEDSHQKSISVNAYKDIDWTSTGRYKANFHTHTSQSFDTQYTTTQVVDKYKKASYDILALTDHDANPYPWSMFDLWNPAAESRDPAEMGMLAIPGCELSKDSRNNWSESSGGDFNHHTDLFTGRQGQEFMSLRESYAYTEALGGLQIINHPGQYWNLSTEYKNGEKNSPEWHAENFKLYKSLVGLEAYNQGNRRQNDRILWDQILTLTMPSRPVWGFSCDDTHTAEQYFRNYQYMLMPELTTDALKEALIKGHTIFSYEYTGSGKALCPHITSIECDEEKHLITINSDDADNIQWISSFHRTGTSASTATNTIVGHGKTFDYTGFQGTYVRALLTNKHGETATQPFGFAEDIFTDVKVEELARENKFSVSNHANEISIKCDEEIERISVFNSAGMMVKFIHCEDAHEVTFSTEDLEKGVFIIVAATKTTAYTSKFIIE
ncbi:MAG: hypothetical protein K2M31_00520 [Muribaculaceae bacterium]|nr:hypothetical protein [Muribaculaceae bacterium]